MKDELGSMNYEVRIQDSGLRTLLHNFYLILKDYVQRINR